MYAHVSVCTYLDTYAYVHIYDRMGGLAGDAERSTSLVLVHAATLCHAAANAIERPRAVQHRAFALLRANECSPCPRKRVQAGSNYVYITTRVHVGLPDEC